MLVLVIGGSGSGKSAYAEKRALEFGNKNAYYAATMEALDAESIRRVQRHRELRAHDSWITLEQPRQIEAITEKITDYDSVVLLECMSNLVANEMYGDSVGDEFDESEENSPERLRQLAENIAAGVLQVANTVENMVVVSNDVFDDGISLVPELRDYLKLLGKINQLLAEASDQVVEVVVGIPVIHKKENII